MNGEVKAKPRIADLVLAIDRLERQALWHEERKADAVAAEREAIVRYLRRRAPEQTGDTTCNALLDISDEIFAGEHYATLQEAQGPDSVTPSASADSCDKNGGTDSSPETSG